MSTQGINIRLSAEGGAQVNAVIRSVSSNLGSLAARFAALAGVAGFGAGFAALARTGVQFNSELEQALLGIAAIQKQLNPTRFKTFEEALESSASAVELLKEKAKTSPASFQELVQAFQSVSGAATSAGIPLQKQIDLVVLMSQALAGLGIRSDQITQESRALLTGNINEDAMAARILGITKQDIDKAKEAGTLFEFLTGRLEAFGEAGRRGTTTYRTLLSNIGDSFQQAAGEATKPLFDVAKQAMETFGSIDWIGYGKRAGAFTTVVIEAWREGRFGEIVGLTIQAGTEIGIEAFRKMRDKAIDFLLGKDVANAIGNFITTVIAGIAKSFLDLHTFFQGFWNGVAVMIYDAIGRTFRNIINENAAALEKIIQVLAEASVGNLARGRQVVKLPRVDPPKAGISFDDAFAQGVASAEQSTERMKIAVDALLGSYRNLFGISTGFTAEGEEQLTAWAKLNQLISEVLAKNAAVAPKPLGGVEVPPAGSAAAKTIDSLVIERGLRQQVMELEIARRSLARDFTLTEAKRYERTKAYLTMEIDGIREVIVYLRQQANLTQDNTRRQALLSRIDGFERDLGQRVGELGSLGPDPASYSEQWSAMITGLQDQFGSWAMQTAQTFATVFNTAISSISDGISGLIMGTKTWGQALAAIGTTILTTVVQSIVQMGVRWVATTIMMATVGKSIAAASVAANSGIAAAQSAVWATPATLATISSYGSAAAAAPAFIAAAQGTVLAQSLAAFADGGWVNGPGGPRDDAVIARLSAGEFVMNADAASRFGPMLEAMNAGQDPAPASRSASAPSVGGGTSVQIASFDTRQSAEKWAKSQDAEVWFVDMAKRTSNRWSK